MGTTQIQSDFHVADLAAGRHLIKMPESEYPRKIPSGNREIRQVRHLGVAIKKIETLQGEITCSGIRHSCRFFFLDRFPSLKILI